MSKVLVDRELLENLVSLWAAKGYGKAGSPGHCHEKPGIWDKGNGPLAGKPCAECAIYDAARAILAQPAEAEGVDFGFDDRSVKVSQEAYSIFMERERHHLAALSAVTAERDRLLAFVTECTGTAGGMASGNRLSSRAKELIAAMAAKEA